MTMYVIAAVLMVIGALLIYMGKSGRSRTQDVRQSHSVAVNGDNSGVIVNTNVGHEASKEDGERGLMIAGIIVHVVGIALAVWEIYERHFAGK